MTTRRVTRIVQVTAVLLAAPSGLFVAGRNRVLSWMSATLTLGLLQGCP